MKEKNKLTIHHIFWYFLIFSVIGIIIETIYCYATMGIVESRKGLIWGPFCPVYGVSASILIIALHKFQDKNAIKLFAYGFLVGSFAEYILSYGLEAIYGIRFWEYTYTNIHINGRICLQYSIYWGILSVVLIKFIKPILDKLIDKIPTKPRNIIEIIIFAFLIIDCIFTVWGIQTYQNRVVHNIINQEETNNPLKQLQQTIENNYFTNERMLKTFPNLRVTDENGNEIFMRSLIENE